MYSSSMTFPYIKARRGNQINQFIPKLPIFQRSFSCVQDRVKIICKNLTHSPDTASQHRFKEHMRKAGNCYTDRTCVKFHAFAEKRGIFSVLFMFNQQTSQELAAGVPEDLSPRKLNLKYLKITPYLFWCKLAKGHSYLRTEVWCISTSVTFNINHSCVQWQQQPSSWYHFCSQRGADCLYPTSKEKTDQFPDW